MGNEADNKFTWVIKNFSSLQPGSNYSDQFVIGGYKWRLLTFPMGDGNRSFLPLYLEVADSKRRRHTKFSLTIVNQISEKLSHQKKKEMCFDQEKTLSGFPEMIPYSILHDKVGGFLVNNEVKIVVEVEVLEVIGKLDVSEEPKEATQPLKKVKREDAAELLKETLSVEESIDVNGFQVLPSQVKLVKRIFERHPDIALEFRPKNQHMRTGCIYFLISLIETLCKSVQKLSNDDLLEADNALTYLKTSGFKVDWLEQKLEEIKVKKKEEQTGETQIQELEEVLEDYKQTCSDMEAQLEKEKSELEVLKQKWSDKEAMLEKEKVELNDRKQRCSDVEAQLEKEKARVLAAIATPLTLDDVL